LCASMPGMHECSAWKTLCSKVKESAIKRAWECPEKSSDGDDEDPPPMRMFLHFSKVDYILFSWWVPRDYVEYGFACVCCLLLGTFSSTLRVVRVRAEAAWSASDEQLKPEELEWFAPPSASISAKRAFLLAVVSFVDFMLMLVVMSFNVGIIFSCVAGLALGHFMFSHMTPRKIVPSCCCAGE
jgi:hypothetical protein